MPKVIMTCGKICSGKSTYAKQLSMKEKAVILSVDEITLALSDLYSGDRLDDYVERLERYLFDKSVEIVETDINVILDWGLWTKAERDHARAFYKSHGIECEIHYIDVSDDVWQLRIDKRNELVRQGKLSAYIVDEGLKDKVSSLFEVPDRSEADVILTAE